MPAKKSKRKKSTVLRFRSQSDLGKMTAHEKKLFRAAKNAAKGRIDTGTSVAVKTVERFRKVKKAGKKSK